MNGFFKVPYPINEEVKAYTPNSPERKALLDTYKAMYSQKIEVPLYIGKQKVLTQTKKDMRPPHDHKHVLGQYQWAEKTHVEDAIKAALEAQQAWANLAWEQRAAVFLKAADLIATKYRNKINAATMLCQSKNVHQAEIDSACELADFFRFNVYYMTQIYAEQPTANSFGVWNRSEHRALEGFIYAVTPFNFTAIAGNLPGAPALMGNVVLWKPSDSQVYSAQVIMEIFEEAGLPSGVINMITGDAVMTTEIALSHPDFAGLHFTGSTDIFKHLWKTIGNNINVYKNYPRIVGETGGKDFVLAHPTSNVDEVVTGLIRGSFEYQGQKCSASSRAYVPKSLWQAIKTKLQAELATVKMGSPEDPSHFINAVIHEGSFDKIVGFIERAKKDASCEIISGGTYDKSQGYFVAPTVIHTTNAHYESMVAEIFGPVLTIFVYEDADWTKTIDLVNKTSVYALTGAIFSNCRYALQEAVEGLTHAAGNLYLNDKSTGAVVGQQPFGGARASGTNDKAGSVLNLLRWVSPRTVKESLLSPNSYKYPSLG
jgi:1-pyrroline-5-carboxylate dehydrogenase